MKFDHTETPVVVLNCQLAGLAIMRSLGCFGIPLYGIDKDARAPALHSRYCRERFVLESLDSALNRKKQSRPSREPKLDGAAEARLIAIACGQPPEGRARWTLQLLANRLVKLNIIKSISYETVRRALKKMS